MTRKDFELIAEALAIARATSEPEGEEAVSGVTEAALWIADGIAAAHPRFDQGRFLKAAGVPR